MCVAGTGIPCLLLHYIIAPHLLCIAAKHQLRNLSKYFYRYSNLILNTNLIYFHIICFVHAWFYFHIYLFFFVFCVYSVCCMMVLLAFIALMVQYSTKFKHSFIANSQLVPNKKSYLTLKLQSLKPLIFFLWFKLYHCFYYVIKKPHYCLSTMYWIMPYTLCFTPCTLHFVYCTLHLVPNSLYFVPSTLHLTICSFMPLHLWAFIPLHLINLQQLL